MKEIYRKIKGYNNVYQVSNLGNVKSLKYGKERILKPHKLKISGYYQVALCKNGKTKGFKVHQLVAMAFIDHKPCRYKLVVNHKNFNKIDNKVGNLEIVTQRENTNKKHLNSSSKHVGVHLNKKSKKWVSSIYTNGKQRHLGLFENEINAHWAYQAALHHNKQLTLK